MRGFLFLIIIHTVSFSSNAQPRNLCGIWKGIGYGCYSIGAMGEAIFYDKVEVVYIEHKGALITATKIIGDSCVTQGEITWQGYYNSNSFHVLVTVGSPMDPLRFFLDAEISVLDENTLDLSNGWLTFHRMDCDEIKKFNLNLDTIDINCNDSFKFDMPNVFTPNRDNLNDFFRPLNAEGGKKATLEIFNRWGQKIFGTHDIYKGWDGSHEGEDSAAGTYYWMITHLDEKCKEVKQKGFFTLLR
jgi:gliding motility-associated-like protein